MGGGPLGRELCIVERERTDGARTRLKLTAFNTIGQGKFGRVNELTRPMHG